MAVVRQRGGNPPCATQRGGVCWASWCHRLLSRVRAPRAARPAAKQPPLPPGRTEERPARVQQQLEGVGRAHGDVEVEAQRVKRVRAVAARDHAQGGERLGRHEGQGAAAAAVAATCPRRAIAAEAAATAPLAHAEALCTHSVAPPWWAGQHDPDLWVGGFVGGCVGWCAAARVCGWARSWARQVGELQSGRPQPPAPTRIALPAPLTLSPCRHTRHR